MSPLDRPEAGFGEVPLFDVPAGHAPDRSPPAPDTDPGGRAPVREAAGRRRLRNRFLRAGRAAVDDRDLLELLLSGRRVAGDAAALAGALLDTFGTAPRALAARPDRLRTVPGLSEDAVAALKTAEALGIRMARADVPDEVRPTLSNYRKTVEYCRTLAGHREVEHFRVLYLNRKNLLIADRLHQQGTVCHTPVYPREICIRCLEQQATAIIAIHNHPAGCPEPSRADIDMTKRLKSALKTIGVALLDHVIVTPNASFSFQARGLL